MKKTKKVMGLLLALVMVFAMAIPTFASDTNASIKGSITVDNPVPGQTYTAYKIFDVVYDVDKNAYSYTISGNSKWFKVVADEEDEIIKSKVSGLSFKKVYGDNIYTVTMDGDFNAASFAVMLKENSNDKVGIELDVDQNYVTAEDLDLGYYFVNSTSGALCNLITTNPRVTIHDKNDVPFNKVDDKESADVGDSVNYTITGKVPDTTGLTDYKYIIEDRMTDGLTFEEEDVKVVIKTGDTPEITLQEGVDYDYEKIGNGFKLTIDVIKLQDYIGRPIEVTYSAIVNESAVTEIEKNSATLTYGHEPTKTMEIEEKVYSSKIVIDKYKSGDESTKLAGATFYLYKEVTGDDESSTKKYYKYNAAIQKVEWVNDKTNATSKITNIYGVASFDGLADGTYYLEETKAPDGYNLLDGPVEVMVNGSKASSTDYSSLTVKQNVENETGGLLPSTGGMGTTLFYIIGGILVVGAGVLLVVKRRMKSEE